MTLTAAHRLALSDLDHLSLGKRTRLRRLLGGDGPARVLAYHHGLEYGPRGFQAHPESARPDHVLSLARAGGWSAVVLNVGLATRYMRDFAGQVPLLLKLNGKTDVPPEDAAFAPCHASVEDAVRLGADAVGYTLYVGSEAQDHDFIQLAEVREEAERYGMPLVVWARPRGPYVDDRGGSFSLWALDYAARVAQETGADVICLDVPAARTIGIPTPPYDQEMAVEEAVAHLLATAGKSLVWMAPAPAESDDGLLAAASALLKAGVAGLVLGEQIWGRPADEARQLGLKLKEL